jgi:hypothetical protein
MAEFRRSDPIAAFNARAKQVGWTVTCEAAEHFRRRELDAVLALWLEMAGTQRMPARSAFTARVMKPYLPHMSLLERVGSGAQARYRGRLHGTALARYAGDKTGLFLDEVIPAHLVGGYTGIYDAALAMQLPLRVVSHYQLPKIDYLDGESLVAPLFVSTGETPLILSVTYAEPRRRALRAIA